MTNGPVGEKTRILHLTIFGLCCAVYVLVLLIYVNQRDLSHSQLTRYARREGLIANFGSHQKPLFDMMSGTEKSMRLAYALRVVESKPKTKAWELIAQMAEFFNPDLSSEDADSLAQLIEEKALAYDIDPLLMAALISQESAFYETAMSPVGAYGYGQLMPETADYLGVDPEIPEENLEGCAKYLNEHFLTWSGYEDPVVLVLASYNAGPGAVSQYGGVPPYEETQTYVYIVVERYNLLLDAAEASGIPRLSF